MRRWRHADGWNPRPHRFWFEWWDTCDRCKHLQHYETAKHAPLEEPNTISQIEMQLGEQFYDGDAPPWMLK